MGIKTIPHPPYNPDLAPCDFYLFPKLSGCRYETIEEMKEAVTRVDGKIHAEILPEEHPIPWEEDSTLQIGSVAFPPGQCTNPQLHPCHRLFDQDGHQDSSCDEGH